MQVKIAVPTQRTVLGNGLEILLLPDHRAPTVSVRMRYHVGSKDEPPRAYGLAHYLEHLTYVRSKHTEQDTYFSRLHALGASDINGVTSYDHTDYYFTLPSSALAQGLWNERERMHFALEGLEPARVERELRIVSSEWRLRLEDSELGHVIDRAIGAVVPGDHPYAHLPIGEPARLAALNLGSDILPFYRAHYAPNRATLVISGDIDPSRTQALITELFGDLPPAKRTEPPAVESQARGDPPRLRFEAAGRGEALVAAWLLPPEGTKELTTARVALRRLANAAFWLAEHDQLAERHSFSVIDRRFASAGYLVLWGREGVSAQRLAAVLDETASKIDQFLPTGWSGNERSHCIIEQVFDVTSNASRAERMANLAAFDRTDKTDDELKACMDIEASAVKSWIQDYFTPERAVLASVQHAEGAPAAGREVTK